MLLYVLMGQRKCRYDGEYAPEALETISEFGHDENPDFLNEKLTEYTNTNEFDAVRVIRLRVSDAALDAALSIHTINAEVL